MDLVIGINLVAGVLGGAVGFIWWRFAQPNSFPNWGQAVLAGVLGAIAVLFCFAGLISLYIATEHIDISINKTKDLQYFAPSLVVGGLFSYLLARIKS